jgi:hypothetical protein
MKRIILSALAAIVWTQLAAGADELKKETTYSIQGSSVDTTTTARKSSDHDEKMTKYLLPALKAAMLGSQYISDLQIIEGEEKKEDTTWADYTTYKRTSNVFVAVNLPTRISMLFQVEEDYRKCKLVIAAGQAPVQGSFEDGGGTPVQGTTCQLQASLKVTGPLSVYGSYATNINVDALMNNKQDFAMTLAKSWDKSDAVLTTRLNINSMRWEDSLFKFLQAFNVRTPSSEPAVGPASGAAGTMVSRQMIFLGVARFFRQINERILQ